MSSSSSAVATTATAAVVGTAVALGTACYWYHTIAIRNLSKKWEEKRSAERTGRIRAEVRLRTVLKEQQQQGNTTNTSQQADNGDSSEQHSQQHNMVLTCIGTVTSPYTKRMGTPRQGALVPSSRGFVQFSSQAIHMESIAGMEHYSHVWIIFGFHANTDIASKNKKSKVRPPRGGGIKVGQLATRSPHRPNAIGLSLVKMERLDVKQHRLYISALDLVNGTPVYDVKPCVPWDIPGCHDGVRLLVPPWVDQEDALSEVGFTKEAKDSLQEIIAQDRLAPLYTTANDGYDASLKTLQQVLAQDPRASNKRGTTISNNKTIEEPYRIIFGATQIEFYVLEEGIVQVTAIQPVDFPSSSYVDGIPLVG